MSCKSNHVSHGDASPVTPVVNLFYKELTDTEMFLHGFTIRLFMLLLSDHTCLVDLKVILTTK